MRKRRTGQFLFVFAVLCLITTSPLLWAEAPLKEAIECRIKGYEAQQDGNIDEAIACYEKAAEIDPAYSTPHNDLGIIYEEKGWLDKAEAEYKKALAINPNYANAYSNLALLYESRGEIGKAIASWNKRVKLGRPDDAWTKKAKERLLSLERKLEKVEGSKEKARLKERKTRLARRKTEKDETVKTYYNRGKEYYRRKDYVNAIAEFEKVQDVDPEHIYVPYAQRYIEKAKTKSKKLEQEEQVLEPGRGVGREARRGVGELRAKKEKERIKKERAKLERRLAREEKEEAEWIKKEKVKGRRELEKEVQLRKEAEEKATKAEGRRRKERAAFQIRLQKEKEILIEQAEREQKLLKLANMQEEKDTRIESYYNQGKRYYKAKNYTKAILEFKKVLELGRHHIYFPYAYKYIDMAEAELREKEDVELQGFLWQASQQKMVARGGLGMQAMGFQTQDAARTEILSLTSEIIEEKRRREEENAKRAKMYVDKGINLQKSGNYYGALKAFEQALARTPNDAKITGLINEAKEKIREKEIDKHYSQGMEYYRQRKYDKANSEFRKMNELIRETTR